MIQTFESITKIMQSIQFENKHKYDFHINKVSDTQFFIHVTRNLRDSVTGRLTQINNSAPVMPLDISDGDIVKAIFKIVGQFEAHEFVESFRYAGAHAYFPHSDKRAFALFGKSEAINQLLLKPWEFVIKDRGPLYIAAYYVGVWFEQCAYARAINSLDRKITIFKINMRHYAKKLYVNMKHDLIIFGLQLAGQLYRKDTVNVKTTDSQNRTNAA